ncbi:hypothetical protein HPB50_012972 [Hyalomma asiaticum]|uniref:Uncharacterized protein n=1 Tax=Hyalomma asiaticum TaxID=266040 RepID=A0ACB7RKG5_HYAAI|nr:hypothetical protein HPB50_012972 [Hyalomma asiaticum]
MTTWSSTLELEARMVARLMTLESQSTPTEVQASSGEHTLLEKKNTSTLFWSTLRAQAEGASGGSFWTSVDPGLFRGMSPEKSFSRLGQASTKDSSGWNQLY